MSGEKPAPTAAEIASARDFLDDRYLDNVLSLEFPRTADHIRTLLAALDAAEARATAAEKDAAVNEKFYVETCASLSRERTRALTAERDRDELRDALKLYEAFPELATGDTARRDEQRAAYNGLRWVLGLLAGLDDGRQDSVAKAFRPVVEKIKRERDEARAALNPFAEFNETVSSMVPDSSVILYLDRGSTGLRAGDFRRAAEILKEAPRG